MCIRDRDQDLEIVPVINKIDLPSARPDEIKQEIEDGIGLDCSDAHLTGKEITTISINYDTSAGKEGLTKFDKLMSYFNIFLESAFKSKKDEDIDIIENHDMDSHEEDIKTIESEDVKPDLEIYNDSSYKPEAGKEIYIANERKENFFKVITSTSRLSLIHICLLAESINRAVHPGYES